MRCAAGAPSIRSRGRATFPAHLSSSRSSFALSGSNSARSTYSRAAIFATTRPGTTLSDDPSENGGAARRGFLASGINASSHARSYSSGSGCSIGCARGAACSMRRPWRRPGTGLTTGTPPSRCCGGGSVPFWGCCCCCGCGGFCRCTCCCCCCCSCCCGGCCSGP